MLWTRVNQVETLRGQTIKVFGLEDDLKYDEGLRNVRKGFKNENGRFLFDPETYNKKNFDFKLANFQMTEEELLTFAKVASSIRMRFSQASMNILSQVENRSQ